ncbi:tRNA wybutosine-synthesizing protein 4 isoform X1 [Parasteatoda tepidariorum]|uniref:tRNA wybutosine-synthesizing protein 4 isoform X1 n=2 Tax=Parasteatoda tepidariorum TaxID=114398 RepID=UPI001C719C2C|nr:tRNA wybutosine-synthesizing protein 4 isoform X1 [Parasteatoda tepidariorum]
MSNSKYQLRFNMESSIQVQATNDSSIVSKLSASKSGYYEDPYLIMFVDREQKRSSIINRGYYIRFKAIEMVFESWFSLMSSLQFPKSQIISLGAGFDTSYFRLKHYKKLPPNCRYIEVDFFPVMSRKKYCIEKNISKISNFELFFDLAEDKIVASNEEYSMLGIDLRNTSELEKTLKCLDVDFTSPTLFLSECAVTYMDTKSSDGLIKWIQKHFPNSAFVAYEQVYPYDGFGIVMRKHFDILGCPLKSLTSFPSKEAQLDRYSKMGWSSCSSLLMSDFFNGFSHKETERIQSLDVFDEYEMWHEKCHHYILLWACQGIIVLPEAFYQKSCQLSKELRFPQFNWKLTPANILCKRFGHQVILLSPDCLLLSGGFGLQDRKHQRISGLTLCKISSLDCFSICLSNIQDVIGKRMFHTVSYLSDGTAVVLGGRSAPKKVFEKVVTFRLFKQEHQITEKDLKENKFLQSISVEENGDMCHGSWRHSASVVKIKDSDCIVIFGGSSAKKIATDKCCILNTRDWIWTEVSTQVETPSPRHSHSSTTFEGSKIVITGGLSENEKILNSVHVLDCQSLKWSVLEVSGLLPRYSHTSHHFDNKIFLIGGITSTSGISAGIGIIDLKTNCATELSLPEQDPEYPIILSNHCSVIYNEEFIIVGGGGNCFSFGTHFNDRIVTVKIKDLF